MRNLLKNKLVKFVPLLVLGFLASCSLQNEDALVPVPEEVTTEQLTAKEIAALEAAEDAYDEEQDGLKNSNFDLGNWYLSVPVDGGPENIKADDLGDLKDELDSDSDDFVTVNSAETYVNLYCEYTGVTTSSSTDYSRTEFREMWKGNNGSTTDNWGLSGKHTMVVNQKMISSNAKTIIAQIHGKKRNSSVSNEPPMVKVQWESGKIKILYKEGSNTSWSDADKVHVDTQKFKDGSTVGTIPTNKLYIFKLRVSNGKLYYYLKVGAKKTGFKFLYNYDNTGWDDNYTNYFKAGNYLQSTSSSASAKVRITKLKAFH